MIPHRPTATSTAVAERREEGQKRKEPFCFLLTRVTTNASWVIYFISIIILASSEDEAINISSHILIKQVVKCLND